MLGDLIVNHVQILQLVTIFQVSLLMEHLESDPRRLVQGEAVRNLYLLASQAPHMWNKPNIQVM